MDFLNTLASVGGMAIRAKPTWHGEYPGAIGSLVGIYLLQQIFSRARIAYPVYLIWRDSDDVAPSRVSLAPLFSRSLIVIQFALYAGHPNGGISSANLTCALIHTKSADIE